MDKCKYFEECGGTIPPDLKAYGICPECYNGFDDMGVHNYKTAVKANEWAKTAHGINKDAGAFMVNAGGVR